MRNIAKSAGVPAAVGLALAGALLLAACAPEAEDRPAEGEMSEPIDGDLERFARVGLETDFTRYSVDLEQLLAGGPVKDGIPALTDPLMDTVEEASADQSDETRGLLVEYEGERRFYPFSILVWHEVVNDSMGDLLYAATF